MMKTTKRKKKCRGDTYRCCSCDQIISINRFIEATVEALFAKLCGRKYSPK